jgi:hypothetical protein
LELGGSDEADEAGVTRPLAACQAKVFFSVGWVNMSMKTPPNNREQTDTPIKADLAIQTREQTENKR